MFFFLVLFLNSYGILQEGYSSFKNFIRYCGKPFHFHCILLHFQYREGAIRYFWWKWVCAFMFHQNLVGLCA